MPYASRVQPYAMTLLLLKFEIRIRETNCLEDLGVLTSLRSD